LVGDISAGRITIVEAGGPGPQSQRTSTSYSADPLHDLGFVADVQKWLADSGLREYGGWHLHPAGDTLPSPADLQHHASMIKLLPHVDQYLSIILAPTRSGGLTASAWVVSEGNAGSSFEPWYRCGPAGEFVVEGKSWL
jgi:hypothetical protein